ncbi:MAG: hypothetical protein HYV04_21285 [Deltaproteobacteria bacterium]|nr:hypothetical protein [Deltaproteobacteria bacterium]
MKSGSDRTDDFRFHAAFESLEEITAVFQRLMSGSFPDAATKEGIHEVRFNLGFRKPRLGILPFPRSRAWAPDDTATIRFTLLRTFDQEVPRFLKGSSIGNGGALRTVLDSDAAVILADSSRLATRSEGAESGPMHEYDVAVESLLTAIQRWREPGGRPIVYPIFVLSKFDCVRPEVLRAANVDATPPRVGKRGPRATYAEKLLAHNLPRTFAKLRDWGRGKLKFALAAYFFPWVRTEPAVPGQSERIRLRHFRAAGWEPDYSFDEYIGFVESLRDIAAHAGE